MQQMAFQSFLFAGALSVNDKSLIFNKFISSLHAK